MEDMNESVDFINDLDWTDAKGMAKSGFINVREEMHRLSKLGVHWNVGALRFYFYKNCHDYSDMEQIPF